MRLDKYLKVSRLIKRRTVANEACDAGRVMINDKVAKASAEVKVGDIIEIGFGTKSVRVEVLDIQDTTKKEAAKELLRHGFEDLGMTTIWCGYYDGNTKSKRAQEKIGFQYHHTCDEVPVTLLNEVRVGHTNYMTLEMWNDKK